MGVQAMGKAYALIYVLMLVLAVFSGIPVSGNIKPYISGSPVIYVEGQTGDVLDAGPRVEIQLDLSNVTVDGAVIYVWFAKTGDAAIGADDVVFLGDIPTSDVYGTAIKTVSAKVYPPFDKYVGNTLDITVGNKWINFTLPLILPYGEAFYIKLTDVRPELRYDTVIAAAVSLNRFNVTKTYIEMTTLGGDLIAVPDETIYIKAYAAEAGREYNITADGETLVTVVGETYTEPATDVNPEWVWTGFEYSFLAPDAGLAYPDSATNITIAVPGTGFETNITQPPRKVWIGAELIEHESGAPTSPVYTFGTLQEVNITVYNFPSSGTITIKMNETVLASDVPLDEYGSIVNFTVTIPDLLAGWYNFTVTDNHGFVYWFIVEIVITPYILVRPAEVHVGEEFVVTFGNLDTHLGENINVWIKVNSTHYYLLDNFTVTETDFTKTYVLPPASKGVKTICVTRDLTGYPEYTTEDVTKYNLSDNTVKSITVLSSLKVEPSSIVNDGSTVYIIGTGLEESKSYDVWIDNDYYTTASSDGRGNLKVPFLAVGFVVGPHVVTLKVDGDIIVKATFTVKGATLDDVLRVLDDIKADVVEIKADVSTIKDLIAALSDKIDEIELRLSAVNESLAQLILKKGDEVIAVITTKLEDLEPIIVEVRDDVATIKTTVGEVKASVSDLVDAQAEIKSLIETKSGEIVAVIETKAGDILAKLDTIDELISAGVKADTEAILGIVNDIKGKIGVLDDIKSTVDEVKAGQDEVVDTVEGLKGDVSTLTTYGLANIGLGILILILVIVSLVRRKG